eukprot:1237345-Rhodomonas_salina.1
MDKPPSYAPDLTVPPAYTGSADSRLLRCSCQDDAGERSVSIASNHRDSVSHCIIAMFPPMKASC